MAKIVKVCTYCKKPAVLTKEWKLAGLIFYSFECGHTTTVQDIDSILKDRLQKARENNFDGFFKDGTILRKHQVENLFHYIEANGRHQVQDETGLGKTVSALSEIALHPESLPCAIFCKGGPVLYQWSKAVIAKLGIVPQVLSDSGADSMVYSPIIICSLDRLKSTTFFEKNKMKKVIVDEIQLIKNHDAKRTNALRDIVVDAPFLTQLSGTPIENHAGEYFPSLNMLLPHLYHSYDSFLKYDVYYTANAYGTRKPGGLRDPKKFFNETRKWIIRHKMSEVEDMPEIQREFRIVEIADAAVKSYEQAEAEFLEAFDEMETASNKMEASLNVAAKMQKLRQITGLAKVPAILDQLTDFLMTSDRKIAVFCNFDSVGVLITEKIQSLLKDAGMEPAVSLVGLSAEERASAIRPFTEGNSRVLIAKLLASGEGTDLFMCADYIIAERHWNRSKEKQVEGRGTRLSAKHKTVFCSYAIGLGTIDEFMSQLNEQKDQYVTEALEGEAPSWNEADVVKQIAEMLKKRGKKSWKLSR